MLRNMKSLPQILTSVTTIAVTCAVTAAALYYKNRKKEINEVMVFCKLQFNAYNCFDKFISYIESAQKSLSVCMPSIHNPAIQARLIKLIKEKNIKVRIIINLNGYRDSTEFFLKELIDAGAEIKCRTEPYNMQHKFCLVDDKVLLTGTLNWGDDRSSDHWNYVYITSKPQLVQPVNNEFRQMWNTYVDLEEAQLQLLTPSEYESDEDTTEIKREDVTSDESGIQNEPSDMPLLRETQITPELCIP